jgi:hypothetical protein
LSQPIISVFFARRLGFVSNAGQQFFLVIAYNFLQ